MAALAEPARRGRPAGSGEMTILVFGKTGQVATELQELADVIALNRDQADLTVSGSCAAAIAQHRPSVVINAAAYTAVDKAESEHDLAFAINADAVSEMARTCAELGIPFVQISTDYVFDGSGTRPWQTDDATGPLGVYGESKLAGETAVRDSGAVFAILRTSWVFSPYGNNFVKTMLRLSETRGSLNVVADQFGGPTPARAIAQACLTIAKALQADPAKSGIYHFAGSPTVNWCDFAQAIFDAAGVTTIAHPIPARDYPTPARRPANSRLDCAVTDTVFGIQQPDWRAEVVRIIAQSTQTEGAAR